MSCPVEIKPSSIVDAGNGVFTIRTVKKGEYMTEYKGNIVTSDLTTGEYSQRLPNGKILVGDAASGDPRKAGQLINDACMIEFNDAESLRVNTLNYIQQSPALANCCMEWNSESQTLHVVSTRKIKRGEELFCSYGIRYWLSRPLQEAVRMRALEEACMLEDTLFSFLPLERAKQQTPAGGWPRLIKKLPPIIQWESGELIVPADAGRRPTKDECCRALAWAYINPARVQDPYAMLLEAMCPE